MVGTNTAPLRVVFVGWGAMARAAAGFLQDPAIEVVGVAVSDTRVPRTNLPAGAVLITEPSELGALAPDVVAEAASRESVGPWGHAALNAHADFIVSSVSALADELLLASLSAATTAAGRLHIQPGALAGIDALAAAKVMGIDAVEHRIVKPPAAWLGTPAEALCALDSLAEAETFFLGSASEAASAFPKNANVAMTTALAGIGPERTQITLVADPTATTNRHEVLAYGAFGQLQVSISNNPLPDNPKTSAMAALSLARAIENRVLAVVI